MKTAEYRLAFRHFQFDPATGDLHGPSGLVALTPKACAARLPRRSPGASGQHVSCRDLSYVFVRRRA